MYEIIHWIALKVTNPTNSGLTLPNQCSRSDVGRAPDRTGMQVP